MMDEKEEAVAADANDAAIFDAEVEYRRNEVHAFFDSVLQQVLAKARQRVENEMERAVAAARVGVSPYDPLDGIGPEFPAAKRELLLRRAERRALSNLSCAIQRLAFR